MHLGTTDMVLKMSHQLHESLKEGKRRRHLLSAGKDEQNFPQSTSEVSVTSKYLK